MALIKPKVRTLFDPLMISAEDLQFCDRTLEQYQNGIAKLNSWRAEIGQLGLVMGLPEQYSLDTRYYNDVNDVRESSDTRRELAKDNPFVACAFTPLYATAKISKLLDEAKGIFCDTIMEYFRHKYNLKTEVKRGYFCKTSEHPSREVHYAPLVLTILEDSGTDNLMGVGYENLKEDFRRSIWVKNHVTVHAMRMEINDYAWYSDGKMKWDDKSMPLLARALSFFERGELVNICPELNFNHYDPIDFTQPYPFLNLTKAVSIRFYKNRKVEIRFARAGLAQEFWDFFDFDKLIKRGEQWD